MTTIYFNRDKTDSSITEWSEIGNSFYEFTTDENIIEYKGKYYIESDIDAEEYQQEQNRKYREETDALHLTPADVERALYYSDLHMDFDDLKVFIAQTAPQIDLKGLAIEFRANNFYRGAMDINGNRIIDTIGALLGYSSKDMDYLFINKKLPTKNKC